MVVQEVHKFSLAFVSPACLGAQEFLQVDG